MNGKHWFNFTYEVVGSRDGVVGVGIYEENMKKAMAVFQEDTLTPKAKKMGWKLKLIKVIESENLI